MFFSGTETAYARTGVVVLSPLGLLHTQEGHSHSLLYSSEKVLNCSLVIFMHSKSYICLHCEHSILHRESRILPPQPAQFKGMFTKK